MGQIQLPPSPPADELPSYEEAAHREPYRDSLDNPDNPLSPAPNAYQIPSQQKYHSIRAAQRAAGALTLDPILSTDTSTLETLIAAQTRLPPRPCLVIRGNHRASRRSGSETKSENVTDFDFRVDLTRTVLRWGRDEHAGPSKPWSYTTVVNDHDGRKAYRGGRMRARARNAGRIALGEGDEGQGLMDVENGGEFPGLKGWCERFCSDPAGVRSFTYRRSLQNFYASPMRSVLTTHIRSTGYQGHITVSPEIANGFVTVYSPHWINRLRSNGFVYWTCIILQLWILTWPVIWLLERRYEVVRSEWFACRTIVDDTPAQGVHKLYAGGRSEEEVAQLWAPVVREAAWQGIRHGEILGEAEVEQLGRQGTQRRETLGQAGELVHRGQAVLGAMGVRSIGGVNVTGGWGGDSSSSSSRFSMRMG
ncbi:hypothetical protein BDW62DRAFT_220790 [Aspergillus aurantiobrunneus]